MSLTLADAIARFDVDVLAHLDRAASVPMITKAGRQGDVIVLARPTQAPATRPVPADGVTVVRGENGGNTHLLLAEGDVFFNPLPANAWQLDIGRLTVAEGATAYLAHPEHAYLGISPGTYTIRRQREQGDVVELVAD